MSWYSVNGIGAMIHGVERRDDGRVEFTSWLCVFWVPLVPLRSWSGIYAGEGPPDGVTDESHQFTDLQRIRHDPARLLRTFARGLLVTAAAVAPSVGMIALTNGRAATKVEMVLLLASVLWAVALVIGSEHVRSARLRDR